MAFPHIIRHGLDLWLNLSALSLWLTAWAIRIITKNKRGLALYFLMAGWVVFVVYLARIM
jgi:hypothetical protein